MTILERDSLGAFCRHTHVALEGSPQGPLQGLQFGLKDIFDVAGHKTGFGSPDWLKTHEPAREHAVVLPQLLAAGAHLVGKTQIEEMAFSLTGENAHYGTPINPSDPRRVPGGSSSGSAVAVAAGLVDFAIGSDTGGSVRGPASFCGIYGIRPSHGRIDLTGACALARSFDTCGWFAREAGILNRVGQVLLGGTANPPGRLLLAQDAFALLDEPLREALRPGVERLRQHLGGAKPVMVCEPGFSHWFEVFRELQFAEIWQEHRAWVEEVHPQFGAAVAHRFKAVAKTDPIVVERCKKARESIALGLEHLLVNQAVLVIPTMPDIAPFKQAPPADTMIFRERAMSLLCIAGLGRLPQLSLPWARFNGCPLGISLVAARGEDEMLLALAERLGAGPLD